MFVRTARETDVSDIARIYTSRWNDVAGGAISVGGGGSVNEAQFDEERLVRVVQQTDDSGWVVAVDDDEVVAAAGGQLVGESSGEVVSLNTHPEVKMVEAGAAVLQTITAQQVVAGAREQYATCLADDEEALSFYRSHGFEVVSTDPDTDESAGDVRLVRRI
ncbi:MULTISPECIES: GNAT family N-acetyltransferase [Haloferax]|uniref:GNAT family N-acetyltransferase n=1 Tax=Haloferax marinum TaxID=2666143 RepID=A0A6A8G7J2_9EURY|nr:MULTISPECIES: GNAT family N-acetyltransferase [Haloferax]KAB1198031.1 GNAT family N-acetyltransferase [Haloferax sp. CBA1150]MRW97099.1 GNAT family N-acetyltransferase [Haloferax marinum]